MSAVPTQQPQRTRVLVKDILFQEQYALTHTQLDIMSYIFNAISWARVERGYLVLTTKKICSDLPYIGEKTLEASLRELKAKELIEVEIVTVTKWNGAKVRGIKITAKGMKYSNSLYKPSAQDIIDKQLEEIEELKQIIREKTAQNNQESKESEPTKEKEPIKQEEKQGEKHEKIQGFTNFMQSIIKRFGATSEPICNCVKGWQEKTIFYINSYNKLSIITPKGEYKQLKDPREINKFWHWLYRHQERIGVFLDCNKPLNAKELNTRYKGLKIKVNDIRLTVKEIIPAKGGVKLKLKEKNGRTMILSNGKEGELIYSCEMCEEILLKFKE